MLPSLAALLLFPLLLSLGFWQLHRAAEKQQRLDQFAARAHQPPKPLSGHEPLYTPVTVTGHYDTQHAILLDNRIVNHQVGYDVLVPFLPLDHPSTLLVNMGWIPKSRSSAAFLSGRLPGDGVFQIVGLIQKPQHNFVLAHAREPLRWPWVIEDIKMTELRQALDRPLYPFILLLSSPGGFVPHWERVVSVSPERHVGYAVQWFALALTLVIIYFKFSIRRCPHE